MTSIPKTSTPTPAWMNPRFGGVLSPDEMQGAFGTWQTGLQDQVKAKQGQQAQLQALWQQAQGLYTQAMQDMKMAAAANMTPEQAAAFTGKTWNPVDLQPIDTGPFNMAQWKAGENPTAPGWATPVAGQYLSAFNFGNMGELPSWAPDSAKQLQALYPQLQAFGLNGIGNSHLKSGLEKLGIGDLQSQLQQGQSSFDDVMQTRQTQADNRALSYNAMRGGGFMGGLLPENYRKPEATTTPNWFAPSFGALDGNQAGWGFGGQRRNQQGWGAAGWGF